MCRSSHLLSGGRWSRLQPGVSGSGDRLRPWRGFGRLPGATWAARCRVVGYAVRGHLPPRGQVRGTAHRSLREWAGVVAAQPRPSGRRGMATATDHPRSALLRGDPPWVAEVGRAPPGLTVRLLALRVVAWCRSRRDSRWHRECVSSTHGPASLPIAGGGAVAVGCSNRSAVARRRPGVAAPGRFVQAVSPAI